MHQKPFAELPIYINQDDAFVHAAPYRSCCVSGENGHNLSLPVFALKISLHKLYLPLEMPLSTP